MRFVRVSMESVPPDHHDEKIGLIFESERFTINENRSSDDMLGPMNDPV
jgi:hypothetical protein